MVFKVRDGGYSRAERVSDATIHVIGILFSLIAVSVLITLAAVWHGGSAPMVGATIYGVAMIGMFSASGAYHMTPNLGWKPILQRIDHSAIYIKIAGTYTPFLMFSGASVGPFLTALWVAALSGTALRVLAPGRYYWLGFGLYLAMGWAGVLAYDSFIAHLGTASFTLVLIGGALYTIGVIFFLWEMLPFHNTIWHGFVLVATIVFYAAIMIELSQTPPA